tara:strand:+ start:2005 stop:3147 length:1143 start_codon:yes stop_codon:yes gene_type:complete
MHHFIFPTQDTWISSGSSNIDGTSFKDQNFGQDPILELKKEFFNLTFDYPTRALIQFDLTDISSSMVRAISTTRTQDIKNPKFYLRLFEAEGNKELSTEYKLAAFPISQSWDEGRGKFGDKPKVTNGCSWENRSYPDGGSAVTWSRADGTNFYGGAFDSGSFNASQSFSYQSPDVEMDVTAIVNGWLDKSINNGNNYGFLLKFSGSQETNGTTFGHLKFFSSNTHTIYAPKLEVRWDDHTIITGSATGSLLQITSSGLVDNFLSMPGLRESYKEDEKVKFRVKPRQRYVQKTFSRAVQDMSGSYFGEGSGSYSIVDVGTGETIVPFSAYTSMSCDANGNYFIQWLNGFYPDRIYKIIYKLKYTDGQEQIFDNNFEFKIKR